MHFSCVASTQTAETFLNITHSYYNMHFTVRSKLLKNNISSVHLDVSSESKLFAIDSICAVVGQHPSLSDEPFRILLELIVEVGFQLGGFCIVRLQDLACTNALKYNTNVLKHSKSDLCRGRT